MEIALRRTREVRLRWSRRNRPALAFTLARYRWAIPVMDLLMPWPERTFLSMAYLLGALLLARAVRNALADMPLRN